MDKEETRTKIMKEIDNIAIAKKTIIKHLANYKHITVADAEFEYMKVIREEFDLVI